MKWLPIIKSVKLSDLVKTSKRLKLKDPEVFIFDPDTATFKCVDFIARNGDVIQLTTEKWKKERKR